MPILPYDSKMPETDTVAVMLYPGDNKLDRTNRSALQARFRQKALRSYIAAGGKDVPHDLMALIIEHAEDPEDVDKRRNQGFLMGDMMSVLFALHHRAPELISWNRAITVVETGLAGQPIAHSAGTLKKAKTTMMPAAHLWGAFALRGRKFRTSPDVGYTSAIDFQYFMWEAEQLRFFGMGRPPANEPKRRLFDDAGWHLPDDWTPPEKQPGWPDEVGMLNVPVLPDHALADQQAAGWPNHKG